MDILASSVDLIVFLARTGLVSVGLMVCDFSVILGLDTWQLFNAL